MYDYNDNSLLASYTTSEAIERDLHLHRGARPAVRQGCRGPKSLAFLPSSLESRKDLCLCLRVCTRVFRKREDVRGVIR